MVALGNISGWQPSDGPVTTWMASPAAREAARAARRTIYLRRTRGLNTSGRPTTARRQAGSFPA